MTIHMKSFLEDLWEYEQMQHPLEKNIEKMNLMDQLISTEEELRTNLTEEQQMLFQCWDALINEIHRISEKEAFIMGIRCAFAFWIEAGWDDR